jgi:hypothetical protein
MQLIFVQEIPRHLGGLGILFEELKTVKYYMRWYGEISNLRLCLSLLIIFDKFLIITYEDSSEHQYWVSVIITTVFLASIQNISQ